MMNKSLHVYIGDLETWRSTAERTENRSKRKTGKDEEKE